MPVKTQTQRRRERVRALTFSALMCAFVVLDLWFNRISPTAHMAFLTISSILMMLTIERCGQYWGLLTYLTSAVLAFFLIGLPSCWAYIAYFGLWPIPKAWIESRIPRHGLKHVLKVYAFKLPALAAITIFFFYLFSPVLAPIASLWQDRLGLPLIIIGMIGWFLTIAHDLLLTFVYGYALGRVRAILFR